MGITLILFVAAAIAFVDIKVTHKVSFLRKINEKSWAGGVLVSLGIGWAVGLVLGLSGVVVGIASLIASVCTDSVYMVKRKVINDNKSGQKSQFTQVIEFWIWAFKRIKIIGLIITLPIWGPMRVKQWFDDNTPSNTKAAA